MATLILKSLATGYGIFAAFILIISGNLLLAAAVPIFFCVPTLILSVLSFLVYLSIIEHQ